MAKDIKDPKEIFPEIIIDYEGLYGEDLISIILYGSASGKNYRPGKSDINFMIVLSEKGIERLDRVFLVVKKWRKRNVAIPLFLTETYMATSVDSFPIEYLNLQQEYVVVFGKDVLKDLTFAPEPLRLQCEREIKGKLMLLRMAFIETSGEESAQKRVIGHSIPALFAIFKALLHLKGIEIPMENRELIRRTGDAFHMDVHVFESLLDIKEKNIRPGGLPIGKLFKQFLMEMRKLAMLVDTLGGK